MLSKLFSKPALLSFLVGGAILTPGLVEPSHAWPWDNKPSQQSVNAIPNASPVIKPLGKYILIMTFGYLGGQPGMLLSKPGGAAVDTVIINLESKSQCKYIEDQMIHFRNDERKGTVMNRIAKGYTEADIKLIASYFGNLANK